MLFSRELSVGASRFCWAILTLTFGALTALLAYECNRAREAKSWPTTEGSVFAYHQNPNYRFVVNGASYEGKLVSCTEFINSGAELGNGEKNLVKYPLNGKVTVHYDPRDPNVAVLDTRFDPAYWKLTGIMTLVTLICVVGFKYGWRFRRRIL